MTIKSLAAECPSDEKIEEMETRFRKEAAEKYPNGNPSAITYAMMTGWMTSQLIGLRISLQIMAERE